MGTYTDLTVSGYPLIESKSSVVPEVMTIFREMDRQVFSRKISERNILVWGQSEDNEVEKAVQYSCEVSKVIDRLNIMGFSFLRVQKEFEIGRQLEIDKYTSWAEDKADSHWFQDEWNLFKELTFEAYTAAFKKMMQSNLRPVPFDDNMEEGLDPIIKYILSDNEEYLFGFPVNDIRLLLRLACEVSPSDTFVIQDITELIGSGYYGEEEAVCINATRELIAGHPENSSRIILTEGRTDTEILKKSLELLYPHLYEYYSFLDFSSSKSPGGAGHLVNLIKAFSAAGITNRIIALFDNDSAALDAARSLEKTQIPKNIVFRHYPELDILKNFPTIGPNGLTSMNVNGLAASIELYLGEDILRNQQEELTPIQWKGYVEPLKKYQGEVLQKASLQEAFYKKHKQCVADSSEIENTDWSGISAILNVIFNAFD